MQDSAQEIRNKHLTTEEGNGLIKRYDGEFPKRYYTEFLDYVGITDSEFIKLCDEFRSPHLWTMVDGKWRLRRTPNKDGVDDVCGIKES